MKHIILIITIILSSVSAAESTPLKIELGVDGYFWGTDLTVFKEKMPKPITIVKINENVIIISYEANKSYRFENRKLSGVYFGSILDWDIIFEMNNGRHRGSAALTDGITTRMSYAEVKSIIGPGMPETPDYRASATLNRVTLHFSFSSSENNGTKTFFLNSMKAIVNNVNPDNQIDIGNESGLF